MLESISGFLTALKAATPQILLGVALASGLLVFGPPSVVEALGMRLLLESNRALFGIAFLGSVSILFAQAAWWLGKHIGWPLRALLENRRRSEALRELAPDEKAYLLRYVLEQRTTQYFRIDDGIAQSLVSKGVIYQSASVGYIHDGWAFNLTDWARKALSKDKSLLSGAGELPEELVGGASTW